MFDRRRFLIGAGALLTASFVRRASAFSRKAGEPLILSPARKPEETLYVYPQEGMETTTAENGACRLARTSLSRRRLRPGASICAALGIPSTRKTISSAPATSIDLTSRRSRQPL